MNYYLKLIYLIILFIYCKGFYATPITITLKPYQDSFVGHFFTTCVVDNNKMAPCLFDTGAESSFIPYHMVSDYNVVENPKMASINIQRRVEKIRISSLSIGNIGDEQIKIENQLVGRSDKARTDPWAFIVGNDLLIGKMFKIDFDKKDISVFTKFPADTNKQSLKIVRDSIFIPFDVDQQHFLGMFDTASEFSIFDLKTINQHPDFFKKHDRIIIRGGFGHKRVVQIYKILKPIIVGGITIPAGVYAQGLSLEGYEIETGEHLDAIIGSNIIFSANWYFDLENNFFSVWPRDSE